MTLAQLADHFRQRELGPSNSRISYSTKRAYQGYLNKWIVPRWGDYLLPNIKAVEVELWMEPRERIMVLLDVATGLRQSELFALKWKDVDFKNKQLWVTRSIVQQVVGSVRRRLPKNQCRFTII